MKKRARTGAGKRGGRAPPAEPMPSRPAAVSPTNGHEHDDEAREDGKDPTPPASSDQLPALDRRSRRG
jgi:hypothetical protein